jgi:exopolyphosphatase/pppGpp-phosphohydrolase
MSEPVKTSKRLKAYFFEGVMIFLAVLLGFFAENMREETADGNREKQFIRSLIDNLKADSIVFVNRDSALHDRIAFMDTLNNFLTNKQENRKAEAYLMARYATRTTKYKPGQSTLNYLSNSSIYASISDSEVKANIQRYESNANLLQSLIQTEEDQGLLLYPLISQVFDAAIFLKIKQVGNRFEKPKGNPALLPSDPIAVNQLVYHLYLRRSQFYSQATTQNTLESERRELVRFLEQKYTLR